MSSIELETPVAEAADLTIDGSLETQVGTLLGALNAVTGKNRWALRDAGVTDEALVWQPFPGGHSIGALLLHTTESESYWLTEVCAGQTRSAEELQRLMAAETDSFDIRWPTLPVRPLAWYYEQQDQIRERTRQIAQRFDDPAHIVCDEDNKHYALRWLLAHIAWHEAYHGGQAALLALLFLRATH